MTSQIQKIADIEKEERKTNGRWTKEEHQKFMLGLQLYGKNWKKIQALVQTRNGAQIRSHAQKFFIKSKKETSNAEPNDQQQSQVEQASPITQNSITLDNQNYSYFMSKIVGKYTNESEFDFWSHMIDHNKSQIQMLESKPFRKSSFLCLSYEQNNEERIIPSKRIKSQ